MPRQTGVFGHDGRWLIGSDDKYFQGRWMVGSFRREFSLLSCKVESSVRVVDEHRPPGSTDNPGNGHACAMCPQLVATLAIACVVDKAVAVELRPTFSKS